jgi:thiol-disulfide isomerase/thioredoxin
MICKMKRTMAALIFLVGSLLADEYVFVPLPADREGARVEWIKDIGEAHRLAREADKPILVYFTAKWCGPCRLLDQTTFVDPEVHRLFSGFVCLKVDIDESAMLSVVGYRRELGVPTFRVLEPSGAMSGPVTGYMDAACLQREILVLQESAHKEAVRLAELNGQLAQFNLRKMDLKEAERHLARIRELDPDDSKGLHEELASTRCEVLYETTRWQSCLEACSEFLAVHPQSECAERVRRIMSVCRYRTEGVTDQRLTDYIDSLLHSVLDEKDLAARGKAAHALAQIGDPVVESLIRELTNGTREVASRVATPLGAMKSPMARQRLESVVADRGAKKHARFFAVVCLGVIGSKESLEVLVDCLRDAESPIGTRARAARAIADVSTRNGELSDSALAGQLLELAVKTPDVEVRAAILEALNVIRVPYETKKLFTLMDDDGRTKEGVQISDLACQCFVRMTGMMLQPADGHPFPGYTPEVIAYLKSWYREKGRHMTWDPVRRVLVDR